MIIDLNIFNNDRTYLSCQKQSEIIFVEVGITSQDNLQNFKLNKIEKELLIIKLKILFRFNKTKIISQVMT